MRKITIEGVLNGWIIVVGCQVLVSEDKNRMLKELSRYIDNPKLVEEEYLSNAKNRPMPIAATPGQETMRDEQERTTGGNSTGEARSIAAGGTRRAAI